MNGLSDREYQQLISCIGNLYNVCALSDFPNFILDNLTQIISTDSKYCVSFQNQTIDIIANDIDAASFISKITPEYFQKHPILNHHLRTGDWSAFKVSDFMTEVEYHHCDAIYENAYKTFDIEDFFIFSVADPTCIPNPQKWSFSLMTHEPDVAIRLQKLSQLSTLGNLGIGLNRNNRSFTESDRTRLNLFRHHVARAYQYAQRYTKTQQQIAQLTELTEFLGVITLTLNGQIKSLTQRAIYLIESYFPNEWSNRHQLPESLHQYTQHQITQLLQPDNNIPLPSFQQSQYNSRLIIRIIPVLPQAEIILILEEYITTHFSIDSFRAIGLTKRQSEILFYLTQGCTNKDIAQILNLQEKTIKKHLDLLYRELNVGGRIEATALAYNRLGMLRVLE
jgi:DNA-binding CsgD family transcriptional regulator